MALFCNAIVVRLAYPIDKLVCLQESQEPSDSGRLFSTRSDIVIALWVQRPTDVYVTHALNLMLAFHNGSKDKRLFWADWSKRSIFCLIALYLLAHRVKQLVRWRCFANYCERLQVALISCARNFYAPAYID